MEEPGGRATWAVSVSGDINGFAPLEVVTGQLLYELMDDSLESDNGGHVDVGGDAAAAGAPPRARPSLLKSTGVNYKFNKTARLGAETSAQTTVDGLNDNVAKTSRGFRDNYVLEHLSGAVKGLLPETLGMCAVLHILNTKMQGHQILVCPEDGLKVLDPTPQQVLNCYRLITIGMAQMQIIAGNINIAQEVFPELQQELERVSALHVDPADTVRAVTDALSRVAVNSDQRAGGSHQTAGSFQQGEGPPTDFAKGTVEVNLTVSEDFPVSTSSYCMHPRDSVYLCFFLLCGH